ncbi:MAG: 4Fe-4S dicluster domain-containing protein [Candidatus Thorarchaeota archaeon]
MAYLENLEELSKKLRLCYQCGTCSAGCPAFRVNSDKNPRKLVDRLLLGDFKGVLKEDSTIWYCCMCLTCSQRCPQGIDLAHILIDFKNLAVKCGKAPNGLIEEATKLMRTGITTQISKAVEKRRERWGLPKWKAPPMDEIRKLLDLTGFSGMIRNISLSSQETNVYRTHEHS